MKQILSLITLFVSVQGQIDPPGDLPACCEAYPFIVGGNFENGDFFDDHEIGVVTVSSVAECCTACKQTEGCLGYMTIPALFEEDENCLLLDEPHDYNTILPIPFPIYTGNNNYPDQACEPTDCTNEIDIFIVLDKSESIQDDANDSETELFLENTLRKLRFANDGYGARASVTMFGGSAKKIIQMKSEDAHDIDAIIGAIKTEQSSLGWTDLAKTFRYLLKKELPRSRPNAQKLILVVSDGKIVKNVGSGKKEMNKAIKVLRKINKRYENVSLFSVGVGNYILDNLFRLSTPHPFLDGLFLSGPIVFPVDEIAGDPATPVFVDFLMCGNNNRFHDWDLGAPRSGLKSTIKTAIEQAISKKGKFADYTFDMNQILYKPESSLNDNNSS